MKQKFPAGISIFAAIIVFVCAVSMITLVVLQLKNVQLSSYIPKEFTAPPKAEDVASLSQSLPPGELTLRFSEADLTIMAINNLGDDIGAPNINILPDHVDVSGEIRKFFNVKASFSVVPVVENSRLSVRIKSLNLGVVPLPKSLVGQIEQTINKILDSKVNDYVNIKSVKLERGFINVAFERKNL